MNYDGKASWEGLKFVKFDPFLKGPSDREWVLPPHGASDFQIQFASSFALS